MLRQTDEGDHPVRLDYYFAWRPTQRWATFINLIAGVQLQWEYVRGELFWCGSPPINLFIKICPDRESRNKLSLSNYRLAHSLAQLDNYRVYFEIIYMFDEDRLDLSYSLSDTLNILDILNILNMLNLAKSS